MFAIALVGPRLAQADIRIDDVKEAAKTAPLASWTPAQQWMPDRSNVSDHGYGTAAGMLVLADELGTKLSELGRASLIDRCFPYAKEDASSAIMWTVCGQDVKALDFKKLEAELTADGISADSRKGVVEQAKAIQARAAKIGEAVEAAAKDDPGVAAILKIGDAARTEWAAYLAKNKAAFDRYLVLKDAVRSGKSNNKGFEGCWDATFPAFAKLVKATKFPWEPSSDYMPSYMASLIVDHESYITTAAFAACSYSVHESGEALMAAASNWDTGGVVQVGWRSRALRKLMEESFAPKFAERSLSIKNMRSVWERSSIRMEGLNDRAPIMTAAMGEISKVKKVDGDVTQVSFSGNSVEQCLEWKTTNRVKSVGAGGDVQYDKDCKKRGKVKNQLDDREVGTKFASGLAPGVSVVIVSKFPVTAWKGKKFVAVFGVPVK